MDNNNIVKRISTFYVEGFRNMTIGKTLWLIIAIKLIVMFGILKIFFFPNFLSNKADKVEYVGSELGKEIN